MIDDPYPSSRLVVIRISARVAVSLLMIRKPRLSQTGIFTTPREPTPVFRGPRISIRWEGSMRSYLLTAAILAASVCAPPAGAPLAEDIHQPGAAPSVSTDANYNEDTWQTVLPYQGAPSSELLTFGLSLSDAT